MELTLDIEESATALLEGLREVLKDGARIHGAVARGAEAKVKDHMRVAGYFERTNALGGRTTGFYKRVHDSIESAADDTSAVIRFLQRGFALRLKGGTVQMKDKLLSIPSDPSGHGMSASLYPKDLAFVPKRGGGDTAGFLFEKVTRRKKRGSGTTYDLGKMIYVLRRRTTHEADSNLLPTEREMMDAGKAALNVLLEGLQEMELLEGLS